MGNGNDKDKKDQADAYEKDYGGREVPIWTDKLFKKFMGQEPEIYTDFILNVNPDGSAAPDERFEGNLPGKFAEYQTNPKFQEALEEAERVAKETGEVIKLEIREDEYGEKEAVLTDENGQELKGHKPMIIETPGGDHYKPLAKLTGEPADIDPDLYNGKQNGRDNAHTKDEPDLGSKTTAIDNLRGILPDEWFDKAIKPSAADTPSTAVQLETPLQLGEGMKEKLLDFNYGDNPTFKPL